MSGTSMDAIDCVAVDLEAHRHPRLIAQHSHAWPKPLRERLRQLASGEATTAEALAEIDRDSGICLAEAANAVLGLPELRGVHVDAIGSHGQTVAHQSVSGPPATLQLGDPAVIAERTGVTTVGHFRQRDIAAGGQGAPLAPAFHAAMLRSTDENRVVLNLGGIANITALPSDPGRDCTGFDTGPANCLMDAWIRRHQGKTYDEFGAWAASASPDSALLQRLLEEPYFARPAPKSTGTQYFDLAWLEAHLGGLEGLDDAVVQATLLALTATTVVDAIKRYASDTQQLFVCGGGVHNEALIGRLANDLQLPVSSTAAAGIDPDCMEAIAFAWLARQALHGEPSNLPSVTGAAGPRVLGAIYPA